MNAQFGWTSYTPLPSGVAADSYQLASGDRPDNSKPELADLGRLARRVVRGLVGVARAGEGPSFGNILRDHLGEGGDRSVVQESWANYEHVNVQAGIDAWLELAGRESTLVGVVGFQHRMFSLADLLTEQVADPHSPRPGSVARMNVACGPDDEVRPCVRCGVYLVGEGEVAIAMLFRAADPQSGLPQVTLELVSTDLVAAEQAAREIRRLATEHNVYRGQVLSFGGEVFGHGETLLQFHSRPRMARSQVILEPETLSTIERQVTLVARHRDRLLAAGQHLKRGLLLYGPPGVGKTHTVRYLMSSLPDTTVISLTGTALHLIAEACSVARSLQPSMLVVEDVDLIAEDRGMHPGQHPLLFALLNEMDGLAEDADVLFVLTTNRADLLEPALAARPGRVDQAVELGMPMPAARRALFTLYQGPLAVDTIRLDSVLARTEGVTASFLKELLRRAAVRAADHTPPQAAEMSVSADDLDAALDELLDHRNAMTRVLLGSRELP